MNKKQLSVLALLVAAFVTPVNADVIATFEFTDGVLTPTLGSFATDNGITVSDLSAPYTLTDEGSPDLEGVKTADNIAIQGVDTSFSGSGSAIGAADWVTFSITIPSTVAINLESVSADVAGVDIFTGGSVNGHVSRFYSSIQGTDDVIGDTVGRFGFQSGGDNPFENQIQNLADPSGNTNIGGNVSAADFQNLSNITVDFFMPFIDNSSAVSRAIVMDNLQIEGSVSVVPEPSSTLLIGFAAMFGCAVRRRR